MSTELRSPTSDTGAYFESTPPGFSSGPGHTRTTTPSGWRRRPKRWIALVALLVVLIPTIDSYERALTGPGNDALSIRSVEWLRSHHFRWLVNDVENFWYTHH